MKPEVRNKVRQLRRWRIRKKINGTQERPRMCVRFSGKHIYVSFINDELGRTLLASSTRVPDLAAKKLKANVPSAQSFGAIAAEAAKNKGITRVVFDRAGARYHGKVKALADAARSAGLEF